MNASLAARLGRTEGTSYAVQPTGTSVDSPYSNIGGGVSASFQVGTGRDSLILLAAIVVGVIAVSYWAP